MKILHFSDLHVWRRALDFRDPAFKRFLGFANLILRRGRAFPPSLSRLVVEEILRSSADAVVFSGDLTTTALADEFRMARDLFAPIREKWGERFLLIPGNHDRYTPAALRRRHYEANFPHALTVEPSRPVASRVIADAKNGKGATDGNGIAFVGFDAAVPRRIESTGLFSSAVAEALDAELARQEKEGRPVVLIGHFPYAAPAGVRAKHGHRLVGAERLIEIVARRKPVLYLHGHKHRRWAFHPVETPGTLCVNSGSAGLATRDPLTRAGFVEIEIDTAGSAKPGAVVAAHVTGKVAPAIPGDGGSAGQPFETFLLKESAP